MNHKENFQQELVKIMVKTMANSPQQRITFATYMDLVLYHPQYGYYSSGQVKIGSQGDFFTSSSLEADFGELLAEQFHEIWKVLDKPTPFQLVEMGAGQGLLAADILNYLQNNYPELYQVLEYIIIEKSPALIKIQQQKLQAFLEQKKQISWQSWTEIADESIMGCCFANELVDAFPVHQVTINQGQLQEIYVTIEQNNIQEIIAEISTPKLGEYFAFLGIDLSSPVYPDGYRSEVNLAALDWLHTVNNKLKQGYLLTIDYGYPAQKYYHPQRYQGTLQCYYQHRHHHNPYLNLGLQDITTHVDFTALENYGKLYGLERVGFTQQGLFLMALGLGERLTALSSGKFNFPEIMQRREALHQLINPMGLGGFGVLVQSKGLRENQQRRSLRGLQSEFSDSY
jgi:SAM-dependent MidA family methyltransferase